MHDVVFTTNRVESLGGALARAMIPFFKLENLVKVHSKRVKWKKVHFNQVNRVTLHRSKHAPQHGTEQLKAIAAAAALMKKTTLVSSDDDASRVHESIRKTREHVRIFF